MIFQLFKKIWTFYSIIIFGLLTLLYSPVFLVVIFFFPKRGLKFIIWLLHQTFTRAFFGLTLVRLNVSGQELLDENQSYIIVSNHLSTWDFMLNAWAYPGIYRFLAKQELINVPLLGSVVNNLCVLVDRSSTPSRIKSINYLKTVLAQNISVFIYPEGTRNRGNKHLIPFYKGAFLLAIETQTPIAVQTITNIDAIAEKGASLELRPGTVKIVWSKPIETKGMDIHDIPRLREQVRKIMVENLEKEQKNTPVPLWDRLPF